MRRCLTHGCREGVVPGRARCRYHGPKSPARYGPNPYGSAWQAMVRQHIHPDTRCSRCGVLGTPANPMHLDHIIPKSLGGQDVSENVQPLCRRCNVSKGGRNRLKWSA